ncbi:TCRP [Candida oxycetoniae]|uniref:4-hydroxyphenylpyruvate dioxygenase n=1 Tax=Candida oxycetoniae TaxID=497107 RepID=A0AAI9T0X2_9ASCO|nr:TCRP [Candida oxycetoniae]KAI3406299.2 TCRP [Candida oxycetoniae]
MDSSNESIFSEYRNSRNASLTAISSSSDQNISDSSLMTQLPFFPTNQEDPLLSFTCEELISDKFPTTKFPFDGFINFHSLKICSSNAKQMSKYLQLAMGFKEVAYKGLENNSRLVASHVVQNGSIFLEIVNTLETIKNDNVLKFPYFKDDLLRFEKFDLRMKTYVEEFKITTEDLVFDYVNNRIENLCTNPISSIHFGRNMYNTIIKSEKYRELAKYLSELVTKTINDSEIIYNDIMECTLIQKFLKKHAEGVMDIVVNVKGLDVIFAKAVDAGAGIIRLPKVLVDKHGAVKLATITVPNTDIQHTLIENINYTGPFLPGYSDSIWKHSFDYEQQLSSLPPINLTVIDHCVENYSWNQMLLQAKVYAEMFGFHKFWSADEEDVSTGYTALRSIVMSSSNGQIKVPINEPVESKFKGQIEEFNDFYGGPGIQHIAFRTNDIIKTVKAMIQRGIEFNHASDKYYNNLELRLKKDDVVLFEDFDEVRRHNILVDYDPQTRNKKTKRCHYILQIFSQPLHDRPTLFIEIIQRHHHNGFGKGTFKGLFETIEEQQKLRGNFVEVNRVRP